MPVRHSVMISSTYEELRHYRAAVKDAVDAAGMYAIAMETDSARPDHDLIDASLAKVDEANAYVGLISYRYGQMPACSRRNRQKLSLTELEFRRAKKRGLPICMFIMQEKLDASRMAVGAENAEAGVKLAAFTALAKKGRICAEFKNPDDLKTKAMQSLFLVRKKLDDAHAADAAASTAATASPAKTKSLPTGQNVPAAFFAKPQFIPGAKFQGRAKELAAIRDWVGVSEPVMLLEAIGGMGKSMIAWEWMTEHAAKDRKDWVGRLWYSFYERGATMRDFCITTLAYMTRNPVEAFANEPSYRLADALIGELQANSWLLGLDGLERVLVAYHRPDAAQIRDEEASAAPDPKAEATDCIHPDDGELLRRLAAAAPSKILTTSRLMPSSWLGRSGQPRPGVKRWTLVGLDARDAEAMLREAGVTGDSGRMRDFLERKFGCHPIYVAMVGGLALEHFRALGDFDLWMDAEDGGAAIDLTDPDIKSRKNHVLKQAFDGLAPLTLELISRLAIVSNAVDSETLEALNPARPPPPRAVEPPMPMDLAADTLLREYRAAFGQTKARKQRVDLERRIRAREAKLRAQHEAGRAAHVRYLTEIEAGRNSDGVRAANGKLSEMVSDLKRRGLLHVDRARREHDLHPVVRGYAVQSLSPEARAESAQRVADYFASRPHTPYEKAASLAELQNGVQVVQALALAGKLEKVWELLNGGLLKALSRLDVHHEALALLRPLFPSGWLAPPAEDENMEFVAAAASFTLGNLRRSEEAILQGTYALQAAVLKGLSHDLATHLRNLGGDLHGERREAEAERLFSLGDEVEKAVAPDFANSPRVDDVILLVAKGRLPEAEANWDEIARGRRRELQFDGSLQAKSLLAHVELLWRTGKLTETDLSEALDRATFLGERFYERRLCGVRGEWLQDKGNDAAAAEAFGRAIEIAREVGLYDTNAEARRGLSVLRLGRRGEAEAAAAAAAAERDPEHDALAELYVGLGDLNTARHHALAGYRKYWCDGPPYTDYWRLQACRAILDRLGVPPPELPPYDPSRYIPFPFEADIRRLLEQHRAYRKKPRSTHRSPVGGARKAS